MRRTLPLFLLTLGIAAFVVSDAAEARHRRRYRRQQCCPSYNCIPYSNVSPPEVCPKYKMMGMGGVYYYYALEYASDCNTSTPVSYDSSGAITSPCGCGATTGTSGDCCLGLN